MLQVHETRVDRSRFPIIHFHSYLSWGDPKGEKADVIVPAAELLRVMDRKNIRIMVNLTGGYGKGLEACITELARPHPDRFAVFTMPLFPKASGPAREVSGR